MEYLASEGLTLEAPIVATGISLSSLGAAYVLMLLSVVLSLAAFVAARMLFVVTPNRHAKNYGLYVMMVFAALMIAAALENQLVTWQTTAISYALFPQILILACIHFWIYHDQQPWLITLGASSIAGSVAVAAPIALAGDDVQLVHWVAVGLLLALLAYLWRFSISTKRGFIKARSIYIDSNETKTRIMKPQRPWLGLPQWVSLAIASIVLALLNASLKGSGISNVPAVSIFLQSLVMLGITISVCAIPAGTYWLARRHWMPELTRFVWLVWIVVAFAFSYGNFLARIDPL